VSTPTGTKLIEQLEVGDVVLSATVDRRSGDFVVEETEMISFLHTDFRTKGSFVEVYVANSSGVLILSPDHLVSYLKNENEISFIPASSLKPGMNVLLGTMLPGMIEKLSITERVGYIAPLTNSGSLMVDNILASCYIYHPTYSHDVSHFALWPSRIGYQLSKYFPRTYVQKSGSMLNKEGEFHWYANALFKVFY